MKFDKNKVVENQKYKLGGVLQIGIYFKIGDRDYGISAFQDLSPYNFKLSDTIEPYAYSGHNGVDIACPVGTPIVATHDLEIHTIGYDSTSGNYFKASIQGMQYFFCHLKAKPTKTSFKKGEIVAYTGNTGGVIEHLHIDLRNSDGVRGYDLFANDNFKLYSNENTVTTPTKTKIKAVRDGITYYFDIKDKSKFDYSKKANTQNVYDLADKNSPWLPNTLWSSLTEV